MQKNTSHHGRNKYDEGPPPDWSTILPVGLTPLAMAVCVTRWLANEHDHVIEEVMKQHTTGRRIVLETIPPTATLPWRIKYHAVTDHLTEASFLRYLNQDPYEIEEPAEADRRPSRVGGGLAGDDDQREEEAPWSSQSDRDPSGSVEDLPDWDEGLDDI